MDKFTKRISKLKKHPQYAAVVGTGFGRLSEFCEIFQSVFVFGPRPEIKLKNIIYRENFDHLRQVGDVDIIFIDLFYKDKLINLSALWKNKSSIVVIEGDEVLDRQYTDSLYSAGYQAVERQGFFHVWKVIK